MQWQQQQQEVVGYRSRPWNVFSGSGFREEGVERVVADADRLVRRHLTIRLNAMLKTLKIEETGGSDSPK